MRRSLQRGEIATIVAIGTLVIIGVASLFSSAFLGQKQTTSTKAQEATCDNGVRVNGTGCQKQGDPYEFICKSPNPNQKWEKRDCSSGQTCQGAACSGGGGAPAQPQGGEGGATSPAPSKPPETGSGGGDCAWGDWTCAANKCGSDAPCMCAKMGKSLCAPGDGRSDGAGKVCQKNQWDSKWGCWGSGLSTTTSTPYGYCNLAEGSCSQRSQQDPKEHYNKWFKCSSGEWKGPFDSENTCKGGTASTSTSGGTNCNPGEGGPGPGKKYYCCYKAGDGPQGGKKLPFPHYEDEGKDEVDCELKTGVSLTTEKEKPPSGCGLKSYKLSVDRKYICGQGSEDEKFSYENGWCCEPPPPATTSLITCSSSSTLPCDDGKKTSISYVTGSKDGKIIGYFKEHSNCTENKKADFPSNYTNEDIKKIMCPSATTLNCTDSDYDRLADSGKCGGDDASCGKNQKKYTKASNNICNGLNSKCKDDLSCGALSNGELTIPCNSVQCDSDKTGVYQKGVNYYFNSTCDGLPVTTNKATACGPSTKNLSCAFATPFGCWFTNCGPISASTGINYTCKQDLSGGGYCCPPEKEPPNSNSGGTSSIVTVIAPADATYKSDSNSCYLTVEGGEKLRCCPSSSDEKIFMCIKWK